MAMPFRKNKNIKRMGEKRNFLSYIAILLFLISFFSPAMQVSAQTYNSTSGGCDDIKNVDPIAYESCIKGTNSSQVQPPSSCSVFSLSTGSYSLSDCVTHVIVFVLYIILGLMALLLWLAGTLLNFILDYSVINMAQHLASYTGINIAWKVIRDLMNIAFIFMLVFEGILLIIGTGGGARVKKFIGGLILASILINFSLFFTKVLIDASNVVTIGFYNSIIDSSKATVGSTSGTVGNSGIVNYLTQAGGLSVPFMRYLGVASFYSGSNLDALSANVGGDSNLITIAIAGSVLFVIVSFVFFAVAVMFLVRFVVLLILLMLSPIAYMGMALGFMQSYSKQWWSAFRSQLLFPPIYMILTWIILTLLGSGGFIAENSTTSGWSTVFIGAGGGPNNSSLSLVFNFVVIIGLVILSLVTAKKTASEGSAMIGDAMRKVTAFAGGAVMGGSAWVGRRSFGLYGKNVADREKLQTAAAEKTGLAGAWARTKLYTARTARDATFDVRNAAVPTSVIGDVIKGTVGRTERGKKLGLNDVNFSNIEVAAPVAKMAGVGQGGTKGYKQEKEESNKRVQERDAKNSAELAQAQAKQAVLDGKNADKNTTAGRTAIDKMEQALAKLSDKQTEALVASNRDLLKSQNFANSISVKQLEALNKSDQFSDAEKNDLKDRRFAQIADITNTAGLAAIAVRTAGTRALTTDELRDAKRVDDARARVKGLSDSELEMVDPNYLDPNTPQGREFISQLRAGQAENITTNKNGKFTSTQKENVKTERMKPLMAALSSGVPGDVRREIKKVDIKTLVSYMRLDGPIPGGPKIALDPNVLDTYDIKTLQRMALHENMTGGDVSTLRAALLARLPANNSVRIWLEDPTKGEIEFPA